MKTSNRRGHLGLGYLRYFIAVAEELHFGHVAERLGISQPPLGQQIQALEEEIGTRLFERTNRRVELTGAGRPFLDESRQVLTRVDKAVLLARCARLGELGELKTSFTSSAPFVSIISSSIHAFCEVYLNVHLDLQEMSSHQALKVLLEESLQVDVIRPLVLPDMVHWVELLCEPLVAVLRVDHPLAVGNEDGLAIAAPVEELFVFFPRSYGIRLYDQVIALTRQAGFSPRIAQEASEAITIIGLVLTGLGVPILSASFRRTRVDGAVYRTLGDPEATTAVWLARRQNEGSPLALSFIDLVTREAASLRWH